MTTFLWDREKEEKDEEIARLSKLLDTKSIELQQIKENAKKHHVGPKEFPKPSNDHIQTLQHQFFESEKQR